MSETSQPRGTMLIVGATSPIARALARTLAAEGFDLLLAGREMEEIDASAADLRVRFSVAASAVRFDAEDVGSHAVFFAKCAEMTATSELLGVVACQGYMAEQADAERDVELCRRMMEVNYNSVVSVLNWAAERFLARSANGRPRILAAVSSVAGDRGRPSNFLYGATKAALNTYLEGLGAKLSRRGVGVLTIKPGFVDTPMTFGRPGTFLVADPEAVAKDIAKAMRRGKRQIYTPWFWRWIMLIIRSIPGPIFRRMKL